MELITEALQKLIDRIDYGDITRDQLTGELNNIKTELEEHHSN